MAERVDDTLRDLIGRCIRLGLITSIDDVGEVLELAWMLLL